MQFTYFDETKCKPRTIASAVKSLAKNRYINDPTHERFASVVTWQDEHMLDICYDAVSSLKKVKHVVLIGIGGSSLGVEAIHSVLATAQSPQLHIIDTIAPHEIDAVLAQLQKIKKADSIAVCVISKSGTTTETVANAEIVVGSLVEQFGKSFYKQVISIGNPSTPLSLRIQKLGGTAVAMPEAIGGRYSVFTPVGIVPLLLLGHDVEALLRGVEDAVTEEREEVAAEAAARMLHYVKRGYGTYNVFATDTRLVRLGKWHRQLMAESLGKQTTRAGKKNPYAMVPTVSTLVDLHSIGQLYFSGTTSTYTEFVSFDDTESDYQIPKKPVFADALAGKSLQEISSALYGGVIGAYQEDTLPYRAVLFDEEITYSLGLYMALRMLEVIYIAELLDVDAFNQPNVERYKTITRDILKA